MRLSPEFQQIAWIDTETGECVERRLKHSDGEAEKFYRDLKAKGVSVRVGIEATGHAHWFERLLAELKFELRVGDPAQIKATRVRKQKNGLGVALTSHPLMHKACLTIPKLLDELENRYRKQEARWPWSLTSSSCGGTAGIRPAMRPAREVGTSCAVTLAASRMNC